MSRKTLEQVLLEHLAVQDKEKEPLVLACLGLYLGVISDRIAEAISPVNNLSAAFTAAVLEKYAKDIRDKYKPDNRFVNVLKDFINGKQVFPKAPESKKKAKEGNK
ncbi:MAG: hypothetical protein IKY33_01570 [Clostridia bacterium]|nr:hypothetical protein [Clostridia bacterium]